MLDMKLTFAGIGGKQYQDFDDAWMSYYQELYGSEVMDSKRYHELYLVFLAGAISCLNLQATKLNKRKDEGMNFAEAAGRTMTEVLNEAMKKGVEEYRDSR